MEIVVCIKSVPDPKETCKLTVDPKTKTLNRCIVPLVVNPLDRHALEAGLKIAAEFGGKVTVFSMGPPPAGEIIKECLALGAKRGILLCDPAFGGADAYATAFTLSKAIEKIGKVDLVLCGMASSDGATELVGPLLGTFLDVPVATLVKEIKPVTCSDFRLKCDWHNGYRLVDVHLPALLTVTRDLNTPRLLSFSGILKARKKRIEIWDLQSLGVSEDEVGAKGSPTQVNGITTLAIRRNSVILQGDAESKASALVEKLSKSGYI